MRGCTVATLTVWKFYDPSTADRAVQVLTDLSKQNLVRVQDYATVSWELGQKPKTRHGLNTAGAGALGGGFWGLLFGLIFFVPLLGAAIGAATGAVAGSLADVGIDDDFITSVREQVSPGTSALFALTSDAVTDRVIEATRAAGIQGDLIHTNLSNEQEQNLRAAFADD